MRLSGWDFVARGTNGHQWGLPLLSSAARREIQWAFEMVQATDLARRSLSETSGGERQRLLLAQALVGRPRLLYQRPCPMTVFCDGIFRNDGPDTRAKKVSGLGRWYYCSMSH